MESSHAETANQLTFTGDSKEYFKIWIVNIVLSILTLGIYSAWAKVRNKRYFYGNTLLNGSSFDYLANPVTILKGRLIVFGVIIIWSATAQFLPTIEPLFSLLFFAALPWLVLQSLRFNMYNTAFRNVRFKFNGTLTDAITIYIGLTFLILFTLGFAYPYFSHQTKKYLADNTSYGKTLFKMHVGAKSFFGVYFRVFGILMLLGIGSAIIIPSYNAYVEKAETAQIDIKTTESHEEAVSEEKTKLEHVDEQESTAREDIAREDQEQTEEEIENKQSKSKEESDPAAQIFTTLIFIFIMLLYMYAGTYITTATNNLVFNSTTLGGHRVSSTITTNKVFYIYVTNIILILVSVGLLIPMAKIRLAKYKISHLALNTQGNLDDFVANENEDTKATGDEMAEAFDIDFGL